jgi:dihydroflavonol-4-reductase
MDPRRADEMRSVNVRGTDIVLGAAHRVGLDPVVHVSSELALLPAAYPIVMPGGMHIADVRDVAAVLAAVMTPGLGPRRYLVAGHYISMPDLIRTLAGLTGRRIPFATLPPWFLAGFGRAADLVQRGMKTRLPWDGEGIWVMNCAARCDDSKTRSELALEPRPLQETFVDTVRWLVEVGYLTPREAGRLSRVKNEEDRRTR